MRTCERPPFPVCLHSGFTVYVRCDLPQGHEEPCSGRVVNHGAPRFY